MSSAAGFHAPTFQQRESELESTENSPAFGEKWLESLAKFDPVSHLLKTRQTLLFEEDQESLKILPDWGCLHNGECFQLAQLVPHTCEKECSFWPTPRASDRDNCGGSNARKKAKRLGVYLGREQNPQLTEWLMGWPLGWTDLKPLETDKFRQWLRSHGGS
jgi:hypothetical protein